MGTDFSRCLEKIWGTPVFPFLVDVSAPLWYTVDAEMTNEG